MKHQASFSSKDKNKNIKVSSAKIFVGALRVKMKIQCNTYPKLVQRPLLLQQDARVKVLTHWKIQISGYMLF